MMRRISPSVKGGGTRREFLACGAAVTAGACAGTLLPGCVQSRAPVSSNPARRPKVAIVATVVRKYSHAQHFVDRFLEGYGWQGEHHYPPMDLVSLYVDQF